MRRKLGALLTAATLAGLVALPPAALAAGAPAGGGAVTDGPTHPIEPKPGRPGRPG